MENLEKSDYVAIRIKLEPEVAIVTDEDISGENRYVEPDSTAPNSGMQLDNWHLCNDCGYGTESWIALQDHIRTKHFLNFRSGDREKKFIKKYTCHLCNYKSNRHWSLRIHIQGVHEGKRPHSCPHCNYSATITSALKHHIMAKHTQEKPHQCLHCEYSATQAGNLKKHLKSKHPTIDLCSTLFLDHESMTTAEIGPENFKSRVTEIRVRINGFMRQKKRPFRCQYCQFSTRKIKALKDHISHKHIHEKKLRCFSCQFRTADMAHLKSHILTKHKDEPSFECGYCEYTTTKENFLKRHVLARHTKDKPHKCNFCNYSATQSGTLKAHIRAIHTKERPYQCLLCDYSSARHDSLKIHVRGKHSNKTEESRESWDEHMGPSGANSSDEALFQQLEPSEAALDEETQLANEVSKKLEALVETNEWTIEAKSEPSRLANPNKGIKGN